MCQTKPLWKTLQGLRPVTGFATAMIAVVLLAHGGCTASSSGSDVAASPTERCALRMPAPRDNLSEFRRLVAPHSKEANGRTKSVDAALVTCNAMVSLAHDPGSGGSRGPDFPMGPSELLWSNDGNSWAARDLATTAALGDVAFGAETWVAVGRKYGDSGVIVSSKGVDASHWREVFHSSMYPFGGVAYGAGSFVAVTLDGLAISADGMNWHWAQLPDVQAFYNDVAFGAGRFVVAGVGAVLSSTDGEHWLESSCDTCPPLVTPPPPSGANDPPPPGVMKATFPAGRSDGLALQEVHYIGGTFYASGGSGEMTSRDGVQFAPLAGMHAPDAAIGDTLLSGQQISIDDGMNWTRLSQGANVTSADCTAMLCVVAEGGLLAFDLGDRSGATK